MSYISLSQAFANWKDGGGMGSPFDIHGSDGPALAESWNDYTDSLAKDGELCALQYHYCPAYDEPMPGDGSRWDALSDDREFILNAIGVRITSRRVDKRPDKDGSEWGASASRWRVTIRKGNARMVLHYSMGSAHTGTPEECAVLACVLTDAESAEESFTDWCANFGHDTDSRKALRMYHACKRTAASLARLFSASELADLRELFSDY
jgi:hypothetical protein